MKKVNEWQFLGFPLLKIVSIDKPVDDLLLFHAKNYKIIIFSILLLGIGFSSHKTLGDDSIIFEIGITKLEIFTSFTVKNRWFK